MKRSLWAVFWIFAAAVLQGNMPTALSIFGAKPDLFLVAVITYSLGSNPVASAAVGLFAGIVQGFSVGASLGSFALTRMLAGFLGGFCTVHVFSENLFVPAGSAFVLTAVSELGFLLANPQIAQGPVWQIIVGESICNALIIVVVLFLARIGERRRKFRLIESRL
ncbi:MAG: rod shape-determining protein MreD [Armatimonadota bacterium]|nr:rod shape-determining protein MreD [Armatimonadota bacterium]